MQIIWMGHYFTLTHTHMQIIYTHTHKHLYAFYSPRFNESYIGILGSQIIWMGWSSTRALYGPKFICYTILLQRNLNYIQAKTHYLLVLSYTKECVSIWQKVILSPPSKRWIIFVLGHILFSFDFPLNIIVNFYYYFFNLRYFFYWVYRLVCFQWNSFWSLKKWSKIIFSSIWHHESRNIFKQ